MTYKKVSHKKTAHSLSVIRRDYTYTVQQIADLYNLNIATVRRWVSIEGLSRIPKARPHLIHGSQLYSFLEKRQIARKHVCGKNKVFCMKCRLPQYPNKNSGSIEQLPNKTVRFQARCETCNSKINRVVSSADWSKIHPLASYLKGEVADSNESHGTPRKCPFEEEEQLCLILTP